MITTVDGEGGRGELELARGGSLTAVWPRRLEWQLVLEREAIVVGRDAAGAARLEHGTVSRQHLEVRWEEGSGCHVARDLQSRNGVRVDGQRLGDRPVALEDGSVVQIGDVFAIYQREASGAAQLDSEDGVSLPGRSAAMARLRSLVARAAADPSPVLITGETGTGKEWIARALHARSGRRGPLLAVNCAALGRELLESQLFGHVRGAFTGASGDTPGLFRAAEGGTLFLDEIGELPLELQPKLLRALQEREVLAVGATRPVKIDVRVCAATNRDLAAEVEREQFRRDLYARLALWEVHAPPLRARRVDVLDWLDRAHRRWGEERGVAVRELELAPAAVEGILLHGWPENLRGIERLVHVLAAATTATAERRGSQPLTRGELPEWLLRDAAPAPASAPVPLPRRDPPNPAALPPASPTEAKPPAPTTDEFRAAYAELGGNVRALARRYQRDRRQIYRWLDAHGLARDDAPADDE